MDNMKKGKVAEKIISDMFNEAGFKVINYGYEHTVPELVNRYNPVIGKAAEYIRHQPDLIVVNKSNEAFFVEVKFRKEGLLKDKHLFNYPNCYVILLTKDLILAQSTYYLFKKGVNFLNLNKMPPFSNIPYTIIEKYVNKLRRTLGDESFGGQIVKKAIKKYTKHEIVKRNVVIGKFRTKNKKYYRRNIRTQKRKWRTIRR